MTATYPRRRGFGQTDVGYYDSSGNWISTGSPTGGVTSTDFPTGTGTDTSTTYLQYPGMVPGGGSVVLQSPAGTPQAPSSGLTPFWQKLLGYSTQVGGTIALQTTNPLYNLRPGTTVQQTPYGTFVSTAGAVPPGSFSASSLTSGSLMPLLLIGGAVMVFMMMAKR